MAAPIQLDAEFRFNESKILRDASALGKKAEIAFSNVGKPLGRITADVDQFTKSLEASNARVLAFGASAGILFGITKTFKEMVRATVEVEKSLTDINVVLNASSGSLKQFGGELFKIARDTGQSFKTVATAATEISRAGLGLEQTLKVTRDALILTRLSGLDVNDSVQTLIATMNSFSKSVVTSTELVNKLANVDAQFAVSSKDLAEAIKRVGSSAQDVGVDLDQLIALVTSAQQTTARGGAIIGNSFKTIFTRTQRSEVLDQLELLGVKVRDTNDAVLPAITLLENLAGVYDKLGQSERSQVAEMVGGVYQINILRATLGDLSKEYSTYSRALNASVNATDEAIDRNERLNETLSALINRTGVNLTKLGATIGKDTVSPVITFLLEKINAIATSGEGLESEGMGEKIGQGILKGLGQVLTGPVLATVFIGFTKLFTQFAKFSVDATKTLFNLNQIHQVESSIRDILSKEPQLIDAIINKKITLLDVERQLLQLAQSRATAISAVASSAAQMAPGLVSKGVRVADGNFKISQSKIPTFARSSDPLQEAIDREIEAGVNPRSVRAGRDSRLVSIHNPLGIGVYNTEDEPMGLGQGISRAMKEGKNPKTYGIPSFASSQNDKLYELKTKEFQANRGLPIDLAASLNIAMSKALHQLVLQVQSGTMLLKEAFSKQKEIGKKFGATAQDMRTMEQSIRAARWQFGRNEISSEQFAKSNMPKEGLQMVAMSKSGQLSFDMSGPKKEPLFDLFGKPVTEAVTTQKVNTAVNQAMAIAAFGGQQSGQIVNSIAKPVEEQKFRTISAGQGEMFQISTRAMDEQLRHKYNIMPGPERFELGRKLIQNPEVQRIAALQRVGGIERELGTGRPPGASPLFGGMPIVAPGAGGAPEKGNFWKRMTSPQGFGMQMGAMIAAPIAANMVAELAFDGKTRGSRTAKAAVTGVGDIASFAALGASFGGPKGAAIGGSFGTFIATVKGIKQWNDIMPEFNTQAEKAQESFTRLSDSLSQLGNDVEKVLDSDLSIEQREKHMSSIRRNLTSGLFSGSEQNEFWEKIKAGDNRGVNKLIEKKQTGERVVATMETFKQMFASGKNDEVQASRLITLLLNSAKPEIIDKNLKNPDLAKRLDDVVYPKMMPIKGSKTGIGSVLSEGDYEPLIETIGNLLGNSTDLDGIRRITQELSKTEKGRQNLTEFINSLQLSITDATSRVSSPVEAIKKTFDFKMSARNFNKEIFESGRNRSFEEEIALAKRSSKFQLDSLFGGDEMGAIREAGQIRAAEMNRGVKQDISTKFASLLDEGKSLPEEAFVEIKNFTKAVNNLISSGDFNQASEIMNSFKMPNEGIEKMLRPKLDDIQNVLKEREIAEKKLNIETETQVDLKIIGNKLEADRIELLRKFSNKSLDLQFQSEGKQQRLDFSASRLESKSGRQMEILNAVGLVRQAEELDFNKNREVAEINLQKELERISSESVSASRSLIDSLLNSPNLLPAEKDLIGTPLRQFDGTKQKFESLQGLASVLSKDNETATTGIKLNTLLADLERIFKQEEQQKELATKSTKEYVEELVRGKVALESFTKELGLKARESFNQGLISGSKLRDINASKRAADLQRDGKNYDIKSGSKQAFTDQFEMNVVDMFQHLEDASALAAASIKDSISSSLKELSRGAIEFEDFLATIGSKIAQTMLDKSIDVGVDALVGGVLNAFRSGFGKSNGGVIKGYSTGGKVIGGSGVKDDVFAMLSQGEYVVKKSAVNKYGEGMLRAINEGSVNISAANRFEYDSEQYPTTGREVIDKSLSVYALEDADNPQNAIREERKLGFYNYKKERFLYERQKREALEAWKNGKMNARYAAILSASMNIAGGTLGSIKNGGGGGGNAEYGGKTYGSPNSSLFGGSYMANGGVIQKFAVGGQPIGGDNIPAMLMGGEYVINKKAVERVGVPFLHQLNQGRLKGYAEGGLVGGVGGTTTANGENAVNILSELLNVSQETKRLLENKHSSTVAPENPGKATDSLSITNQISISINADSQGNASATSSSQTQGGFKEEQLKAFTSGLEATIQAEIIKQCKPGGKLREIFVTRG